MRAVNLIPSEERRRSSAGGRSGGGVYVLLGALALLVVLAASYMLVGKSIDTKRAEVATIKAQADAAEAKSANLQPYTAFATLRKQRADTVAQLAESRFDWARVLHEVARTIPGDAWLSDLHGTSADPATDAATSSTPTTTGASAATPSADGTDSGPSIDLSGCTSGQGAVARLMVALRRIDGVTGVSLTSSTKPEASGAPTSTTSSSSSGTTGASCTPSQTQFSMTLKFRASAAGAAPAAASTTTTPATAGSTP